jgi:hypothetical protein
MQYSVTVTGASSWTVVGHSSLVVGRIEGSTPTGVWTPQTKAFVDTEPVSAMQMFSF